MRREKIGNGRDGNMKYGNGTRYGKAGFVLFLLLACAAFALWAPDAGAQPTYFAGRGCTSCHAASPTTCNGCHEHGVNGRTGSPQSATVNKTTFAPGENVIVTLMGGRTSSATNGVGGWVRGILYRDNVEIARSAGTVPAGASAPSGGSGLPITFTTPAPTTPGTYTYAAAWFGNTSNSGTGANNHGEVRAAPLTITVAAASVAGPMTVSPAGGLTSSGTAGGPFTPASQSYTVTNTGSAPMNWTASKAQSWVTLSATGGTLAAGANTTVTVSIGTGANSLAASGTSYTDTVTFANTTNGTGNTTRPVSLTVTAASAALSITTASLPIGTVGTAYSQLFAATGGTPPYSWSISSGSLPEGLNLSASGLLDGTPTATGTSSFTVRVTDAASATSTKVFLEGLTINPVAPPTGALDVMPPDAATDVPVNTVITATESGSTDIRTIFNGDTFTLRPDVSTPDTTMDSSWPYRSGICTSTGVVQGTFSYNAARTRGTFTPNCPLANGTTYLASIAAGPGSTLTAPDNWTFTTIASSPDSDDDGSPDNEDDSPNDDRHTSRWDSKGHGKIHIDSSHTAGMRIRRAMPISDTSSSLDQSGKPAGYEFLDGMIAFEEVGVASGNTAEVTVTFPSPIPPGSKVYQARADGFHEVRSAFISGNTVTLTLTGGSPSVQAAASPSDNVAQENGVLVDPIGVAAPVSSGSGSVDLSSASGGGGCSVAVRTGSGGSDIDGTLILLGLGLTVWGIRMRRRRG